VSEAAPDTSRKRLNIVALVLAVPFVGFATFLLHEGGHWAAGELLGHDMALGLNRAAPVDAEPGPTQAALLIMIAGGVGVTLVQGLIGLLILRWSAAIGYAVVFFAFFMRLMALGITVTANPNDEAQIGLMLGVGPYILHIVVVLALLGVTIVAARRAGAGWAANVLAYLVGSATITAIVYLDTVIGRIL